MNNPQHMMDAWGSGYGMFFMVLFWIVVLALIITLIWFLIRKGGSPAHQTSDETPQEILDKRYVRGEIDEEQYRRMKKEINR